MVPSLSAYSLGIKKWHKEVRNRRHTLKTVECTIEHLRYKTERKILELVKSECRVSKMLGEEGT